MDRLYAVGTQKIFSSLSVAALQRFDLPTEHVHFDTTSVSLYGDYLSAAGEEAPFNITHGYSKHRRPDLKQFVVSLLCVGTDVPNENACPGTDQILQFLLYVWAP